MADSPASLKERLAEISGVSVKVGCKGSQLTHMKVGEEIENFLLVSDTVALKQALDVLKEFGCTWKILGAGSNVVIGRLESKCWVVKLSGSFDLVEDLGDGLWTFGSAVPLIRSSLRMTKAGWSGLEFAAGIPGVIGGAIAMNAGAHGSCMAEVVESVTVLTEEGEVKKIVASDLGFNYRTSRFNSGVDNGVILSAQLRFKQGDPDDLLKTRAEALAYRKATQPLTEPSSGSVFRNPSPEKAAGMLIEAAGLKGKSVGGAMISELHANWIVNPNRTASARDVRQLIELCQKAIVESQGIELEPEVRIWGVA